MKLKNEFSPIREWAEKRGLYEKGDVKTQYIKLQEECGELANAILKNNEVEFIDAIGDIIVVLTNLTELSGFITECKGNMQRGRNITIEDCINSAYTVIKNRSGSMQNGTFIKDAK